MLHAEYRKPWNPEPSSRGTEVTKNEIIEKTLKEIGPRLEEHEEPYSEEPDWEEIVIAELHERLPETDIKTCEDFRHLNVTCCDTCHTSYPHYEMSLIDLPDGAKAWVCDPVKWAIYPEQYQELQEWKQNSREGKLLRRIFGEDVDE
jgi:hypothetical protein